MTQPLTLCFWILATVWAPARAQDADPSIPLEEPVPTLVDESDTASKSTVPKAVNARYRFLTLPAAFLDPWYFPSDETLMPRSKIRGHSIGFELSLEKLPANFIFYADYFLFQISDGYWDDREEPAIHSDGDWLAFNGLGAMVLGANFAHEFEITDPEKPVWFGIVLGGGLGGGLAFGVIERWRPGRATGLAPSCLPNSHAVDRKDECSADVTPNVPPVIPVLDLGMSFKFHFDDIVLARFDVGLHGTLSVGGALGAQF